MTSTQVIIPKLARHLIFMIHVYYLNPLNTKIYQSQRSVNVTAQHHYTQDCKGLIHQDLYVRIPFSRFHSRNLFYATRSRKVLLNEIHRNQLAVFVPKACGKINMERATQTGGTDRNLYCQHLTATTILHHQIIH